MSAEQKKLISGTDHERLPYYFRISLAGKKIEINCRYKSVFRICKDYLSHFSIPDFAVSPDPAMDTYIAECINISKYDPHCEQVAIHPSLNELESYNIYFMIANKLLDYGIILFHGAAIAVANRGFVFIAPSGTGKTTHIMNWLKVIPKTTVINGDKPLVDVNQRILYGTPWCGKEKMNSNTSVQLSGIISLQRDDNNTIKQVQFRDIVPELLNQVYIPNDSALALKTYTLINQLKHIPCYKLKCNKDKESAIVAYNGLFGNLNDSL